MIRCILFLLLSPVVGATVLHVGAGHPYANVRLASLDAQPGDTIYIHAGTYTGGAWIENLNGTPTSRIVIRGEDRATAVFEGSTEAMHFVECSYVNIENVTVRRQTGNGINIDDAGTFDTPTHHIVIRNVTFMDMNASGNNDFLKLSGLDDFAVTQCLFERGSAGGSGIDMVGCHRGLITNNMFRTLGSNAIQAKGGTQFIRIRGNMFVDAGERSVNLGGSTGLQFFRPIDAPFEAADLQVWANVFIRSITPIAYVGAVRIDVANNTIIQPVRWIFRVLQETVDASRFAPCGNNSFRNNIVVYRSSISTHVNIGANTAPETFTLSNNLWYNADDPSRSRPQLGSITEGSSIYGLDPLMMNTLSDQRLQKSSPAIGKGLPIDSIITDFEGNPYASPPSIGAFEEPTTTDVVVSETSGIITKRVSLKQVSIYVPRGLGQQFYVVYDLLGRTISHGMIEEGITVIDVDFGQWVVTY